MTPRAEIRFRLNDRDVSVPGVGAQDTLLDFLRLGARLTGTKEGCAEGDCGACTVLVGRLHGGALRYEAVNACIRFLASCDGCHIVTVEHLRGAEGGALHPVQAAMVARHGSQCGFCTPGIVMALYALWMEVPAPTDTEIERALQGNLCRCTGYSPIVAAARDAAAAPRSGDVLVAERDAMTARLAAWQDGARVDTGAGAILPADADDLAAVLAERPEATLVAGATDVGLWVTKQLRQIAPAVFIGHMMKDATVADGAITLGAGVTYSEAEPLIAAHLPAALDTWQRIGGWQVRNAGTVGGNIANGSPIGDAPPLLIALGATLTLRHGTARRTIPLESFFLAYGKQDRARGEFVESVTIPIPSTDDRVAFEKISKRREADISALALGLKITVAGGRITAARLAYGGMDGIPRRAAGAEAALTGAPFAAASFEAAARAVEGDFTPLSDWRASADYRRIVAGNLLRRFWAAQPEARGAAA